MGFYLQFFIQIWEMKFLSMKEIIQHQIVQRILRSLSNKRSRAIEEVEEEPAVEMTAIPKSKSKEEEQPEKPKTQSRLMKKSIPTLHAAEKQGDVFFGLL
jgi:hypothetical protein